VFQPQYSCGLPLSRELTREKHERLFVALTPWLAELPGADLPQARFWIASGWPTIHELPTGICGCVSHQLSTLVRSIGFKDCRSYLQNASTSGPSGDVALEERSEIVSAGWEFPSAVADPREVQVYDGIDQAT
jgi:hypothetical protein